MDPQELRDDLSISSYIVLLVLIIKDKVYVKQKVKVFWTL